MMRTPAVHVEPQLLDLLKNGAQFRLFEIRGTHATVPLNHWEGLFGKILIESISQELTVGVLATD
jgi:hypothetical protein